MCFATGKKIYWSNWLCCRMFLFQLYPENLVLKIVHSSAAAGAGAPAVSGAGEISGAERRGFSSQRGAPLRGPRYWRSGWTDQSGRAWEYFTLETSVSYQNWRKQIIRLTQCCQQPKQKGENYFSNYFNIFQRYNRECSICCQKSVSICISAGKDSTSNQLKSSGFVEPELLKILSKYKITRRKQKKTKRKGKGKQQKVKDMLLAHKQNTLPSNYDKGTTIQHGISEMIAERNRLFSILEFMLLVMVHSPHVVFICPGINYFSTKQLGVFWATQAVMQDNSQHPLLHINSENMYIRLRRRKSRPEIEHKWCTAQKSPYV